MRFRTIPELFFHTVNEIPDLPALCERSGGKWHSLSYREVGEMVETFAYGLADLGVKQEDKVAILSCNNPRWAMSDYAIACLGAVSVTIYPNLIPSQIEFILVHSDAKYVITENSEQTEKITSIMDSCPHLLGAIVMDDSVKNKKGVFGYDNILRKGKNFRAKADFDFRERAGKVKPDDLLTLVYTSGTTGDPKGVMLTHRNLVSNVIACREAIHADTTDRFLSFLPLSHCFERNVGHYAPFSAGCVIYYAEGIDELARDMAEVRPTVMASVPRLFEKMHGKVTEKVNSDSWLKQKLFRWAMGVGGEVTRQMQEKGRTGGFLRAKFGLADRLVLSKIRKKVGGDLRFFFSGGAPLSREIGEFFSTANLPIIEGYGLTETSPVITCNREGDCRYGTVGLLLNGVEVRIEKDGEILCRGDNVMKGYYKDPEATKEVMDPDGWFRTGDIGEFDRDGYLMITDRKKNLLVTSTGKNIAPVPLENALGLSKFVEHSVVLGNNLKYVSCIIIPSFPALEKWASEHDISAADRSKLLEHPKVKELYENEVKGAMKEFAGYERVKKFSLIVDEWTVENGMLTPTLKVKRRLVQKRYADVIEDMYS